MRKILIFLMLIISASLFAQATLPQFYWTNEEINDKLAELEANYPNKCKVEIAGYSQQDNMPIHMVKLSNDVDTFDESEPVILLNGPLHAEEILGVSVTMETIINILENNNASPYNAWLEHLQIYVIPILNPEGYEVVMDGIDTSYRKNKRDNNNNGSFDFSPNVGYDIDGVDNNRNFPFNWVHGDTLMCSTGAEVYDYYRGSAPLSESETRLVYDFCQEYKPIFSVQWHSSRTGNFSEKVYYPWYWYDVRQSPDFDFAQMLGEGVASQIMKEDETGPYECYPGKGRKGSEDNTLYQQFGTIQLLIECGTLNLQPETEEEAQFVIDECNDGTAWLLNRALPYSPQMDSNSMLTGRITDALTGQALEAEIIIEGRNPEYFRPRMSLAESGRYWRPLLSGQYTLKVKKEGYYTHTEDISVYSVWTQKHISLQPLSEPTAQVDVNISGFWGQGKLYVTNHDLDDLDHEFTIEDNTPQTLSLYAGNNTIKFVSEDRYYSEDINLGGGPNNFSLDFSDFELVFDDDFNNLDNWTASENWEITSFQNSENMTESFVSDSKYSPFNFEQGFDNNFYEPNCDYQLITSNPISINPEKENYIKLDHWLYTEWFFDFASIEISPDNSEWTEIWAKSGQHDYLHVDWAKIPDSFNSENLYFKLRLKDDNAEPRLVDPGWNIDNVSVISYSTDFVPNSDNVIPVVVSKLNNNYPNPFNPETTISFTLDSKKTNNASIDIFNLKGQKITTLPLSDKDIQSGKITWNADKCASGLYFYRLKANGNVIDTKKATLIK